MKKLSLIPILDRLEMPPPPIISEPPAVGPNDALLSTPIPANDVPILALNQATGPLLSKMLLFLQAVMEEYEITMTDWKQNPTEMASMLEIRAKLGAAEAAQTPPALTNIESEFLQAILLEYQETHTDWRRFVRSDDLYPWALVDFDLMISTTAAVGANMLPPIVLPAPSGSDEHGIFVPPQADPYQ